MIRTRFEHDIPVVQYFARSYRHGRKAVFFVCAAKVRNPEKLSKPIWNASTPIFGTNMKKPPGLAAGSFLFFGCKGTECMGATGTETAGRKPHPAANRSSGNLRRPIAKGKPIRTRRSDRWTMRHISTERNALLRQKQLTGQAGFFADEEFSPGDADEEAAENGPQPPSYSGIAICCTGCSRFRSSGWDW